MNGCTIVTGSRDNSVWLWDAVTGSQQKLLLDASAAADDRRIHLRMLRRKQRLGWLLLAAYLILVIATSSGSGGVDATSTVSQREKIQPGESVSVFSTGTGVFSGWCMVPLRQKKRKI